MNRLTKNMDTQYDFIGSYDTNIEEFTNNKKLRISVMNKLGQLEDMEEELKIDLITLFKASKQGIFVKEQNTNEKEVDFEEITLDLDNKLLLFRHPRKEIGKGRYISQYGKTWALTREELENL